MDSEDLQYAFFVHAIQLLFEEPDEEVLLKRMLHDAYNDLPILDDARKGMLLQIESLPQDLCWNLLERPTWMSLKVLIKKKHEW